MTASRRRSVLLVPLTLLGLLASGFQAIPATAASTFTVRTAGDTSDAVPGDGNCDDGTTTCTLRAAIQESNALAGLDTIRFSILTGVQMISVGSALPPITDSVVIDGTTQPAYAGSPLIQVNGTLITPGPDDVDGFVVGAQEVTITGLSITGFTGNGVRVNVGGGGSGHHIAANYIGLKPDGSTGSNGGAGILGADNAPNTTIGPGNVIAKNAVGVRLVEADDTSVIGNVIGTDPTGTTALGNLGAGIRIEGTGDVPSTIGGAGADGNVISGNLGDGVYLEDAEDTVVENNLIGTTAAGDAALGNAGAGIKVVADTVDATDNQILDNVVAGNTNEGILLDNSASANSVTGTVIASNFVSVADDGTTLIPNGSHGISVAGAGGNDGTLIGGTEAQGNVVRANGTVASVRISAGNASAAVRRNSITSSDPATPALQIDAGANNDQAAPSVDSVTDLGGSVYEIAATVTGSASSLMDVDFFESTNCVPSPQSETYIGSDSATTDATGTVTFDVTLAGSTIPSGHVVSAIATDPNGNSSNISVCTAVVANTTPGFSPARTYDLSGTGAHSVVTGDFDEDNHDDVVVSNPGSGDASFLSGATNGHLGAADAITLAGTPRWMAAGKVDADDHLDLIVNTGGGTLRFASGNGDGTFDAPTEITVDNDPASIALADVNGDGKRDLIAADTTGADLSVSFGAGDGTFGAPAVKGIAGGRYGVDVGLINADSDPDIVVTGGTDALVYLNDGSGVFEDGVPYATGSTSTTPTPTLADVNGDNAPDLVVSGSARVLINDGAGVFGDATEALASTAFSAAVGDFNGDGQLDIEGATGTLTTSSPDLVQAHGAGDGTFTAGPDGTLPYRVSTSIVAAGLNANVASDLVIPHDADSKVTVLLGRPTPQVTNLVVSHGPDDTLPAGFSPLDQRSLNFAGVDLDPAILSGAAGPLDAPLQGRPLQGRPLQGRPLQGRPLQGRPLQGRPLQGRFLTLAPPSAFAFAPFETLVDQPITDPPLITQIGLDVLGGWPAQLEGTPLATLPPQEIDLNEVIGNATVWGRIRVISLDHWDLSETPLGSLPPIAELAGSAKLVDFAPASDWTETGGWLETMSPVCTSPVTGFDPTQRTLVDLALLRCPLTVVPWETLRIQDFDLTATNSLLYSYGMLGIDPAAIVLRHGTDPATTLGALTLDNVPTGIVDCGMIDCDGSNTLADAFELMNSSNDYVIQRNATFAKFLTGGATNGGGTATADDLLSDMTAEQFLLGAIAPQDFPYILLSTNQLLDAVPPTEAQTGAIPYAASFDVACPTTPGTSISFTLPDPRFGYVRGSASFDIGDPVNGTVDAGNPAVNDDVLTWDLPDNAEVCGALEDDTVHVDLGFLAQPAPIVGAFNASARISTADNYSLRSLDPTPITLEESGGPKTLSNPQDLADDELVLGQFSSPSDVNFYNIPLTAADVGSLVTVVLSNGNEQATADVDNDLMMYGSAEESLAAAPLQGRPLQGRPIGDQEGCLPPGYVLNGQGLEGVPHFDTTTLAVRGFSTNRSDYPEIVCTTVQEADVADGLTIQVSHFAGSTGDHPYILTHIVEQIDVATGCVGPTFQFGGEGQTPTGAQYPRVLDAGDELPAGAKTLFLINADRFGDLYGWDHTLAQPGSIAEKQILDDLQALAARPEVNGYILPVETGTGTAVDTAYTNLTNDPCSVTDANRVVSSINELVRDIETPLSGPRVRPDNVVLVGDDDVIPFARLRDSTTLGNQVAYAPTLRSTGGPNPISKAFGRGHILSDEPFGTTLAPISVLGNVVYVADTALGRLIETPAEIHGQIQQYISVGGVLNPKTRLSTGADFASGVGEQIADTFKDQTDALNAMPNSSGGYSTKALLDSVTAGGPAWSAEPGWTKGAMLCRLDGFSLRTSGCLRTDTNRDFPPPGLISVSGHANHLATLAGDGTSIVTTDDLAGVSRNATDGTAIPDGSLLFTIGCNAGVNIPDSYLPQPDNFDFPQALASRRGSFFGNFGFGYGDTTRLAFSEKLMKLFANNLDGSATIGQAITRAKGAYWSQLVSSSPYDVKSLEQSTLYGLPFYRITGAGTTNDQNAPDTVLDPDTGLPSTVLSLPKENTDDEFFVDPTGDRRSGGDDGEFFVGPNTQVVPGQPIQPTSNPFFLTQPGLRLHGALVTDLSVQDIPNFDPVVGRLVLDGTPGLGSEPIVESGVFPTAYSTLTTVQGDDYMVLNGGRFTATGQNLAGKFVGTQRIYTQETVRALWSDRSGNDFTAPDVSASGQLIGNGYASFTIRSLATDVSAAYVMYRPTGGLHPERFKLVRLQQTAPGLYSGTVQVGPDGVSEFFGEVADTAGNVGFDVLKGASVALTTVSVTPPPGVTTQIVPDSGTVLVNGFYSGPVDVVINQRNFASIQTQVDFGPAQFFYPSGFFSGTTARVDVPGTGSADGIHRVDYVTAGRAATVLVPIDGLPPAVAYQIGSPRSDVGTGAPYVTHFTPISVVVTDAASGVESCTIERFFPASSTTGGVSFPCGEGANPVELGVQDGRYRFRTVAIDNVGHSITVDQVLVVTRDTMPPVITPTVGTPRFPAVSPTPFVTTATDITMNIVDPPAGEAPGSGVASCTTTLVGPIPTGGPDPAGSNAGCDPLAANQVYNVPSTNADGTYRFDTTATDRVGNTGAGSQTVKLDNTAPIFGMCPTTPLQRSATVLAASGTGTGTSFTVNEEATPPRLPFVIKVDNELMKVTKRTLVGGTTSQFTYTVARGQGGSSVASHGTGSGIAWDLLARQDLLGTPNASINAAQTTIQVKEERFGAPALPFTILVDNEQMTVTARTAPSPTFVTTYIVTRGANGTLAAAHTLTSQILWTGDAYGLVKTALNTSGTSLVVQEGRFGPTSVPFDITVDGERMTVLQRSVVPVTHVATYVVVRGVNGTKVVAHAVNAAVAPPPVGAVYLNSPAALRTLSIEASDDVWPGVLGSGVATNASQVVPGGSVGTFGVTFGATDNLGNSRTKLCSYEVVYKFSGFYVPVDMTIVNSRNAGAAVPVKWKITDFNLAGQTSPTTFKEITGSKTIPATSTACSATNPDFSVAAEDVRGGSALQNQGGGMWQYNWSPNTAKNTCTTMTVRLRQSGLSHVDPTRWYQYAVFSFK